MENKLTGHLFALLCVTVWGTTFLVSKSLMQVLTPIQLMWLRFGLAYVILWLFHPVWHFCWREDGLFLLTSLFANTLYFLAENTALQLTQTANVSILVTTAPIMTAILLRIFQGERISRRQGAGFAVAFVGVILVVLNGALVLHLRPVGDLLALLAALLWAVYGILVRRCSGRFNSFLITRKLMFYGLLTATPLLLCEGQPINLTALVTAQSVMSLLYLSLVGSALCYLMWNSAIRRLGALHANLYMYAVPLVTLIAGSLLLHERVTAMGLGGMVLVTGGMLLSTGTGTHA